MLAPDPTSARRARRHVAVALERAGSGDQADVAALLVSELVTNALLHARSAVTLRVEAGPGGVRVEVADASPRRPTPRRYSPESSTGRGLLLLQELASRWGVEPRAGGKAVWFRARPARRSDEHHADLLREFALLSLDPTDHDDVPGRLLALVAELEDRYADLTAEVERSRDAAEGRGEQATDLVVAVPESVRPSAARLLSLLEEADEYCRRGEHLLTLASTPDVVAFRRWYLGELAAQVAGAPPTPWR